MYSKWWNKVNIDDVKKCDIVDDNKKDSANELSFANVGGVFVVLAIGLGLSFVAAFLEFIWKAKLASHGKVLFFY